MIKISKAIMQPFYVEDVINAAFKMHFIFIGGWQVQFLLRFYY